MNSAQTRAAIKRASQQARNAMQVLDGETVDALVAMYEDAAAQVKAAIRSKVDGSDAVPVSHLRDLLRQIEDVITRLGESRDALLVERLQAAAELGVRPYTLPGVASTGIAGQAVLESAAAMKVSTDAVSFVQAFTAVDGLTLSDRVWRLNLGAKEVLTRAISQAVVSGWDAQRAAAAFMYNGDTVPADVSARVAGGKAANLMRSADLLTGQNGVEGGEVWKADRVFRTEINRAHGTAYMAGAAKTPGFAGFRFLLSNRHPKPDICDLLAAQNLYGLGEGVYPTADTTPWPAHPNTLSFVVMVFEDEISNADKAGKETVTDAMGRMSPAVREGILGVQKAELYDAGKIKTWMIRSPLYRVKERLAGASVG